MMRGHSRWQPSILTVADCGGARLFRRLPNRNSATLARARQRLVPGNALLCSDSASAYAKVAAQRGIEHFVVVSKPGTRVSAKYHHIQNVDSLQARYGTFIRSF